MRAKLIRKWRSISYWGRWWIKAAVFTATVYFGYDLYGRFAWWNFQSSYAAKGVSFDLESHFQDIAPKDDYFKSPTMLGWIGSKDPALVAMLTEWPKGTESGSFATENWAEGTLPPLRDHLTSWPSAMSDEGVVKELLRLMAPKDAAFAGLISDSDRTGVCWKGDVPRMSGINDCMKILKVRVRVHIQTGNIEKALEELIAGIRFAQRNRDGNTLVGMLIQFAAMGILEDAIWDGLRSRKWDEAQLSRLLTELRKVKITEDMSSIGISEMAWVVDSVFEFKRHGYSSKKGVTGWNSFWFSEMKDSLNDFSKSSGDMDDLLDAGGCLLNSLMPKGHRRLGLTKYGEYWGVAMIGKPDSIQAEYDVDQLDRYLKDYDRGSTSYKAIEFFGFGVPTFSKIGETALERQQFLDLAILSCQLELHLKRNGEVPKSIQSVFEVPRDRFSPHLSIRYERTGMTSYRLIACGNDRVDNKGAMSLDPFFEIKAVKK